MLPASIEIHFRRDEGVDYLFIFMYLVGLFCFIVHLLHILMDEGKSRTSGFLAVSVFCYTVAFCLLLISNK